MNNRNKQDHMRTLRRWIQLFIDYLNQPLITKGTKGTTMTDNNIFTIGKQQTTGRFQSMFEGRDAQAREITDAFLDADVLSYDFIWLIVCGGAGKTLRNIKEIYRLYPEIRRRLHTTVFDFDTDAENFRDDFDVVPLGSAVNGYLPQVLRKIEPILTTKFNDREIEEIRDMAVRNPEQTFTWGAGANPLLGRLGFEVCRDDVESFVFDLLEEFQKQHGARKILPIIISGAGGGTGRGIYHPVQDIVHRLATKMGLLGTGGAMKLIMGWQVYNNSIYNHIGQPNERAELMWQRSMDTWNREKGAIFVKSEHGPQGLLAAIKAAVKGARVINNNTGDGGYPNALLTIRDLPPWMKQRIAAYLILRGQKPGADTNLWKVTKRGIMGRNFEVALAIDVRTLTTVEELSVAYYMLEPERAIANLRGVMRKHDTKNPVQEREVTNWTSINGMIAAARDFIYNIANSKLLATSGSSGAFILPMESELERPLMRTSWQEILMGTDRVVLMKANPIPSSVPLSLVDWVVHVGGADVLFEQGKIGPQMAWAEFDVPDYTPISMEDQQQARKQQLIRDARNI